LQNLLKEEFILLQGSVYPSISIILKFVILRREVNVNRVYSGSIEKDRIKNWKMEHGLQKFQDFLGFGPMEYQLKSV